MKKLILLFISLAGFFAMGIGIKAFAGCRETCYEYCELQYPYSPSHESACKTGCNLGCPNPAV